VRLCAAVFAVVFTALYLIRLFHPEALTSRDSISWRGQLLFLVLAGYGAALAGYLWAQPGASLTRLRVLTITFLVLWVIGCTRRQYLYLTTHGQQPFAGAEGLSDHLIGANVISIFSWALVMIHYGVLVPEPWPRVLAVTGLMALTALATTLAAGLSHPTVQQHWGYLFSWSAVLLALSSATATYASFQSTALRREASEARLLGQYHLERLLGSGGMGEVYLAEHRLLKRPCAVKLIRPERAGDLALLHRFEREVRATAALTHPNTVAIYDYGHAEDGTFYYVMEYLPGLNLDDLVKRHGPLPPARAVHLLRQLCGALAEAHAAGLVHRDIKPGNVIVCRLGGRHDVAKLLDFGLVRAPDWGAEPTRLTSRGALLGTPLYMAPEQARGAETADARSDLYSLGALAYFLLTGQPPFQRDTALETIAAHLADPVPPLTAARPDVPADVEAVVLRCLAKSATDRFPDVRALEEALAACACAGEWAEAQARAWWQARPVAPAATV
jgi:serine/threonine-protein kinase